MKPMPIIGWDVGGAHLKAVLLDAQGNVEQVVQAPCPLWQGLHMLEQAIEEVLKKFNLSSALHAITMTGELVDLFASRQSGVYEISRVMHARLNGHKNYYIGGQGGGLSNFVSMDEVNTYWQAIASANWLASATFVAKHVTHGVLIDMGSTSTDFILISNHELICQGFTDATRMQTEELVYTGLIRTPLMAITQKITFQNTETSIAAEYFSTTADVYRLTGDLSEKHDMANTADGKEKSQLASARRIARMIGRDVDDAPMHDWQELAQSFKKLQISRLREVAKKQLARLHSAENISIIGAGAGHRVVREMALDMGLTYKAASDLVHHAHLESDAKDWINVCLPAYAVARLALLQNAQ